VLAALVHARSWWTGAAERGAAPVIAGAAGVATVLAALTARGLRAGYWPLTNRYEFSLAFALATALATLLLTVRVSAYAAAVEAVAFLMAGGLIAYARFALPSYESAIQPLPPALDSVWMPLHVGAAAMAYGCLALAGSAGLACLVTRYVGRRSSEGCRTTEERLIALGISVGYPLLTLSILLGMIWAQAAWGRYWAWDLKEVWTLVTWLVYTLYWHVRRRPRWSDRWRVSLAVVGLALVWFTFLGVGWLARVVGLESLHLF
jgi:cytochrome c-type biogenesis protein CcsB